MTNVFLNLNFIGSISEQLKATKNKDKLNKTTSWKTKKKLKLTGLAEHFTFKRNNQLLF